MQHENIVEMEHMCVRTVQKEHQNQHHQRHIIQIQAELYVWHVVIENIVQDEQVAVVIVQQ